MRYLGPGLDLVRPAFSFAEAENDNEGLMLNHNHAYTLVDV